MKSRFDCDDVGEPEEYIGCKTEFDEKNGTLTLTQPVLIQSFVDEFDLPTEKFDTPAAAGTVLVSGEEPLPIEQQQQYRKGVGKLLHLMRWTRPDVCNATREISRFGGQASAAHMKAMLRIMKYCVDTKHRGITFRPFGSWNGRDQDFEFEIEGLSDSDYAKDPLTRRSVNGWLVKLNGAVVTCKSKMMPVVALSVTEAELYSATCCVQDMLHTKRLIESMGLKVKTPMKIKVDNKGAKDLMNNWSVSGRTRHIEVKQYFIRDLKDEGLLEVEWIPTEEMTADIFTKNLPTPLFQKHAAVLLGDP